MRYQIQTTYKQNKVNLTISADHDFDIKKIFDKIEISNLLIYEEDHDIVWDIWIKVYIDGQTYDIISDQDKIIDAYEMLAGQWYHITYINSLSRPLDDKHTSALLEKLEQNFAQKKNSITPAIINAVEEMQHDIISFAYRFAWYAEKTDIDVITSMWSKLSDYLQIWDIYSIRSTMEDIITKMEILESSYIKSMSTDKQSDQDIAQFNKQLSMIMGKNKSFRYRWLNIVSWWSKLDYIFYKLFGKINMFGKGVKMEFDQIIHTAQILTHVLSNIIYFGIIVGAIFSAITLLVFKKTLDINRLLIGAIWLCCYMISKVRPQKPLPYLIKIVFWILLFIILYKLTVVNLGM